MTITWRPIKEAPDEPMISAPMAYDDRKRAHPGWPHMGLGWRPRTDEETGKPPIGNQWWILERDLVRLPKKAQP